MRYLTLLPNEMIETIVTQMSLSLCDIDMIHTLMLTSKYFYDECENESTRIYINLKNFLKTHKVAGSHFFSPPPLTCKQPYFNCLISYQNRFYDSIEDTKRCRPDGLRYLNGLALHRPTKYQWFHTYYALHGAYILKQYQFISYNIVHITKGCLGMCNSQTYQIWNQVEAQKGFKEHFEATLFIIIKIAVSIIKLSVTPSFRSTDLFFDQDLIKNCITSLNHIFDKHFRRYTYIEGIYGSIDSNNDLYGKILEYYSGEKRLLSLEKQKVLSSLVFDNLDYDNIKNHYSNKTLHKCNKETLIKYLKSRYIWCTEVDRRLNRTLPTHGNKEALVNRINQYIERYDS